MCCCAWGSQKVGHDWMTEQYLTGQSQSNCHFFAENVSLLSGCFTIFLVSLVFCIFTVIFPYVVFFCLSCLGVIISPKFEDLCFSSIQENFQ